MCRHSDADRPNRPGASDWRDRATRFCPARGCDRATRGNHAPASAASARTVRHRGDRHRIPGRGGRCPRRGKGRRHPSLRRRSRDGRAEPDGQPVGGFGLPHGQRRVRSAVPSRERPQVPPVPRGVGHAQRGLHGVGHQAAAEHQVPRRHPADLGGDQGQPRGRARRPAHQPRDQRLLRSQQPGRDHRRPHGADPHVGPERPHRAVLHRADRLHRVADLDRRREGGPGPEPEARGYGPVRLREPGPGLHDEVRPQRPLLARQGEARRHRVRRADRRGPARRSAARGRSRHDARERSRDDQAPSG